MQATSADASVRGVADAAKRPGKASELEQLMSATTSSVHAQYSALHEILSAIIDKQTGEAGALERQNFAAATAQLFTSAQAAAMQKIDKGYADVLNALQRASVQEVVTEEALLDLWTAARRRLLAEHKSIVLASIPCTMKPNGAVVQTENLRFEIGQHSTSENMQQVECYHHKLYMHCQQMCN